MRRYHLLNGDDLHLYAGDRCGTDHHHGRAARLRPVTSTRSTSSMRRLLPPESACTASLDTPTARSASPRPTTLRARFCHPRHYACCDTRVCAQRHRRSGARYPRGGTLATRSPMLASQIDAAPTWCRSTTTSSTQITTTAQDASFNGINLLNGDDLKLTFNETGKSTLNIKGVTFNAAGLGLAPLVCGHRFPGQRLGQCDDRQDQRRVGHVAERRPRRSVRTCRSCRSGRTSPRT